MDSLKGITQFNTGSTIANGLQLSDVALNKYKTSIEGLSLSQAKAALSTTALNEAQQKQILTSAGLLQSTEALTLSEVKEMASSMSLSAQKKEEILTTLQGAYSENEWNEERLEAIVLEGGEAGAIAKTILAKKAENAENIKNIASGKALTAVLKEQLVALASNPLTWVIAGVAGLAVVLHNTSEAIEEVRQKASELSNEFNTAKSDVESYKTKIEELHTTINDNNSSIAEVTTARQSLMTIQDELIDKFGDEKETIDLVTDAINNQSSALDTLIEKQWQETKNKFNESNFWNDYGNWRDGYSDNIDRMADEMENAWANLTFLTKDYNSGEYDDIIKRLEKDGWKYSYSSESFIKGGSTEDLYEEILKLQEVFGEDIPDKFSNSLTKQANEFKNTLDSYEDMWDSYVLNDKIFKDEGLANNWKEVNDAYTKYQNAVASGDSTAIEESMVGFATSINKVLDDENVSDSVKDYFKDMYPVLYREVEQWEFKTQVIPKFDTKGLQGKTQADVLEMLQTKGTQEGEKTFNSIVEKAIEYGLIIDDDKDSIQQLLDLLVEWGILQGTISDTAENANKIDVSLDDYKKASEGISSLATAFKELTDSEYVSIDTISKIKEAVGDSVSNWDEYEQKLLSVKKGTAEYNQLMRELTYATLEKQLGGVNALANANEKYVAQLLKENGVLNANEVAHSAVERAKAKESIQSKTSAELKDISIKSLLTEADASGITRNAYLQLIAEEILFNRNDINTKDKCAQILNIASTAGVAVASMKTLNSELDNVMNKQKVGSGARTKYAKDIGLGVISEKDRGEEGKGKGNLYTYNGQEFEDLDDATYYKNAHDALQRIKNSYKPIELDYSGGGNGNNKETFDWIETAISRLQRSITNFGKTVSATWKSWTDRNSALKSQISAVTSEINLQQQAADKYWALAESITGLGDYKELVKNGALDISTISDENTINAIKQYEEYYNAYLSCLDAKQDAENELASLVREDFDMIAKQFDSEISLVEANMGILEAYIDQAEMKGNLVSKNYYSAMYAQEEKNLSLLQQKYEQLSNKLSNGSITRGTEEWNAMSAEIMGVKKEIIESQTALEEYNKIMRELDWEVFELTQDKIGNVTEESDFLIDLMSHNKLTNDDGSFTEQGQATLGLHAVNYQTYIDSAEEYGNEIAKIDKKLASDPNNQYLLDKKQEYIELQRESILAAEDEKQAIVDLVDNGYDVFLDYLDESINKYKELLHSAKDLHDYEKQVSKQTEEIARLQNIINSYNGDTSEEAKSAIQKYTVELKDAQEALEETEYEKYINDQEQMLDALYD